MSIKEFIEKGYRIEVFSNAYAYSSLDVNSTDNIEDLEYSYWINTEFEIFDSGEIYHIITPDGDVSEDFYDIEDVKDFIKNM